MGDEERRLGPQKNKNLGLKKDKSVPGVGRDTGRVSLSMIGEAVATVTSRQGRVSLSMIGAMVAMVTSRHAPSGPGTSVRRPDGLVFLDLDAVFEENEEGRDPVLAVV